MNPDLYNIIDRLINENKNLDGFAPLNILGLQLSQKHNINIKACGFSKLSNLFDYNREKYELKWFPQQSGPDLPSVRIKKSNEDSSEEDDFLPIYSPDKEFIKKSNEDSSEEDDFLPIYTTIEKSNTFFNTDYEYYYNKLIRYYYNHIRLDRIEINRISKILHHIDRPERNIVVELNSSYLIVYILRPGKKIELCIFDFFNQDPRIFFHIKLQYFRDPNLGLDSKHQARIIQNSRLHGEYPFFPMNTLLGNKPVHEKDDYILNSILICYEILA